MWGAAGRLELLPLSTCLSAALANSGQGAAFLSKGADNYFKLEVYAALPFYLQINKRDLHVICLAGERQFSSRQPIQQDTCSDAVARRSPGELSLGRYTNEDL